jgi:uroporphyrinogen decarboxylase
METLGRRGGYILMASQNFENDVPNENIEAVYAADRSVEAAR